MSAKQQWQILEEIERRKDQIDRQLQNSKNPSELIQKAWSQGAWLALAELEIWILTGGKES